MKAGPRCISCLRRKQAQAARSLPADARAAFLAEIEEIIAAYGGKESSPALAARADSAYAHFAAAEDVTALKSSFNRLLLSREEEFTRCIAASADPVRTAAGYACAANYIDFSAVENVNEQTMNRLLEGVSSEAISDEEYEYFKADLSKAQKLTYVCDNCGEIVLDKLLMKTIKQAYPQIGITALVRGGNVTNDATLMDAEEAGLPAVARCIGNGNSAPGTVLSLLSVEALSALKKTDVIISKGQGNFESLCEEGLDPYFLLLCKCEMYMERFGLKQFTPVFVKESRLPGQPVKWL